MSGFTGMSCCVHCGTLVSNISNKCSECGEHPFIIKGQLDATHIINMSLVDEMRATARLTCPHKESMELLQAGADRIEELEKALKPLEVLFAVRSGKL